MRRVVTAAIVAAWIGGAATPMRAEVKSVTGELVTIMCYTKNGDKGRGENHVSCAVDCAKKGYPLAVLATDGTLYQVVGKLAADDNAKIQSLLAKTVVATGDLGQAGDNKTIDATTIDLAK